MHLKLNPVFCLVFTWSSQEIQTFKVPTYIAFECWCCHVTFLLDFSRPPVCVRVIMLHHCDLIGWSDCSVVNSDEAVSSVIYSQCVDGCVCIYLNVSKQGNLQRELSSLENMTSRKVLIWYVWMHARFWKNVNR